MAVKPVGDEPASTAADEKKNAPTDDDHKKALKTLHEVFDRVRAARAKAAQAESQTPAVADSAAFRSGAVPVNQTAAGATEAAKGPAQVQANADKGAQLPPPGQEASKAKSAAAPIEDMRQGLGGGIIDQTYAAFNEADKRASSGIDSVRSDTPGVSQAASAFRGVAGFVKDLGLGIARGAVMTSPIGQADTLFQDAELGAKAVNGEVSGQQVVDKAKAVGAAVVEPVTKPWNRGDRVEAGTRAVTEVGSLFFPASKAGLFGKAAKVAGKADDVAKGSRLAETTKAEAAVNAGAKAEVPAAGEAGAADKAGKPAAAEAAEADKATKPEVAEPGRTNKVAKPAAIETPKIPQGLSPEEFRNFSKALRDVMTKEGLPPGETFVHGSRARGTATPGKSDIDVIHIVSEKDFAAFVARRLQETGGRSRALIARNASRQQRVAARGISRSFESSVWESVFPALPKSEIPKTQFSIATQKSPFNVGPFIPLH